MKGASYAPVSPSSVQSSNNIPVDIPNSDQKTPPRAPESNPTESEGPSMIDPSKYPIRYQAPQRKTTLLMKKDWLLVVQSRNLLINYIPKVMTTSLRYAVADIECYNVTTRCAEWRRAAPALRSVNLEKLTRVVTLRDPLDRAFSAYENSAWNEYIYLPTCESKWNCTFGEWIDYIHGNSVKSFRNEHFLPQVKVAQLASVHFHYVLRMSSSRDQDFLWNDLLNYTSVYMNRENNNTEDDTKLGNMTERVVQQLVDLYRQDLQVWLYLSKYGTPKVEATLIDAVMEKYPNLFREFCNLEAPKNPRDWVFPLLLGKG